MRLRITPWHEYKIEYAERLRQRITKNMEGSVRASSGGM